MCYVVYKYAQALQSQDVCRAMQFSDFHNKTGVMLQNMLSSWVETEKTGSVSADLKGLCAIQVQVFAR